MNRRVGAGLPYGSANRQSADRPFAIGPRILGALVLAGGAVGMLAIAHSAAPSDSSPRSLSPVRVAAASSTHLKAARHDRQPAAAESAALLAGANAGNEAPAWLASSASLIDTPSPLQARPVDAALIFAAATKVPGFGALSADDAPVGLGTAFTARAAFGFYAAKAPAEMTGSVAFSTPAGANRRLASLPPVATPGIGVEDGHPPRTAYYDISARAVYLPNGEKLEAHSGLGAMRDNPSSLRIKMRGVTPPNVYRLQMRERLFHGVQAIRLLPEDEGTMFRRTGILAHTYMLGPNGDSNGCVSFRDYPRFLNAFLRGDVERLVVVSKLDRPPSFYKGREPPIARATPSRSEPERRSGRRLAYAGGDKPAPEDRGDLTSGFKSWLSSFTTDKPAALRN